MKPNSPKADATPWRLAAHPDLLSRQLNDDGVFPNNKLPLLFYRQVVAFLHTDPASVLERLFASNIWENSWRDGIYSFHHYHSTSHEVLGIYAGAAQVQLGGNSGLKLDVRAGDVLVIPAGVAHCNLGSSPDFGVLGAYPEGREWDMNYGRRGERPAADRNIDQVPMPSTDPLYGSTGPLVVQWKQR